MQPQHQLAMRAANGVLVGAGLQAEDLQRFLLGHAPVGAAAHGRFPARHVLAPGRMDAIEIGLDELRRLLVRMPAILPEQARGRRAEACQVAAGEHAFQHAAVHLAGVVVELHLQVIGLDARGLSRASAARCRRRPATAAACDPR